MRDATTGAIAKRICLGLANRNQPMNEALSAHWSEARRHEAAGDIPAARAAYEAMLAIEPMLVLGTTETAVLDDDWSVVTADGGWAAHAEHTIAITEDGPEVLTLP